MRRCISAVFALIITMTLTSCASTEERWQEQYDLGSRYLAEGNYEEAIIAFTAAIEIDEKRSESYHSRGQAYYRFLPSIGNKDDFALLQEIELEKRFEYCYEQAIRDFIKAIELNPTISEYYDDIMQITLEYGDIELFLQYGELKYSNTDDKKLHNLYTDAQTGLELMSRLAEKFQDEDDNGIFELMQGDSYEALLALQDYLKRPILQENDGKTLGVYRVDDEKYGHCMIYYGDYKNGSRSGEGAWYGYYRGNNYASQGEWQNDIPNGNFSVKEWNSNLNTSVIYRLISGTVSSGLWDGDIVWAFDTESGHESWSCTFKNGIGVIVNEYKDESGVMHYNWSETTIEGKDSSLSAKEGTQNVARGIAGFTVALQGN